MPHRVRDQARELIATQAANHVTVAHDPAQPLRHDAQQLVAGIVAMAVIDGLEVVQVEEQYRQCRWGHRSGAECVVQTSRELAAVGQLGQAVVL